MPNKFLILMLTFILSACGATVPTINTEIVKVDVPIAVPCKAVTPEEPDYSFPKLKESQNIHDKSKVLLSDRKLHLAYEAELTAALKSCIK